jgi:hypothetical protein
MSKTSFGLNGFGHFDFGHFAPAMKKPHLWLSTGFAGSAWCDWN